MDPALVQTVQRLRQKGLYDDVGAPIKEGKESIILLAYLGGVQRIIKVHKIETSKFEKMMEYLTGDPRFARARMHNRRAILYAWSRKEFANLRRSRNAGVRCPEPYGVLNNVVVIEFIGDAQPAPLLREADLEDPQRTFNEIIEQYRKLYKAGLVHADMSEYNILVHDGAPWFIDFAQAVVHAHPKAQEFFERDVTNIVRYFKKSYGIDANVEDVMKKITSR